MKKQAFIVSHTHWDREWYLPFHKFRMKLLKTVDMVFNLLEMDPDYKHFVLDGQAVILEDYLELRPGYEKRIKKLVDSGRLSIGPWYILPDEFLVSAESTIRNLILGHRVCADFGGAQKVGYMPDSFGHIAQIPQILSQAGIDSFIYTRGSGEELDELGIAYNWIGPDGSSVLAINQLRNYCNAGALGYSEFGLNNTNRRPSIELAVRQVGKFLSDEKLSTAGVFLLNNGCDHLLPQPELPQIISALREAYPEVTFQHCDYRNYLEAVRRAGEKGQFRGELRHGKYHLILSGVWSSRMYLKQKNEYCQNLLSHFLEPLLSYAFFQFSIPYPDSALRYCWKLLLKNHPHDSICGCSTDEVHLEMMPRFNGVIQTAEQTIMDTIGEIIPDYGETPDDDLSISIFAFNPLPFSRSQVVQRLLCLPKDLDLSGFRLVDASDRTVDFEILKRVPVNFFEAIDFRNEVFTWKQLEAFELYRAELAEYFVEDGAYSFWLIQFLIEDFPALGHQIYRFKPQDSEVPDRHEERVKISGNTISNEFLRATLHPDGSIDFEDLISGRIYNGLNRLESTEDIGDEYDYSPARNSKTIDSSSCQGTVTAEEQGRLSGQLKAAFAWRLPRGIQLDRSRRSEQTIDCGVVVQVMLSAGSPFLEIKLDFDNKVQDHRLRAVFPTPVMSDTLISDGHFYINERKMRPVPVDDWVQAPVPTHPQQGFSLVQDEEGGLALFNKGLPEAEGDVDKNGQASIGLTLMRSVGWLSRGDLLTRHGNAGPMVATPDAQCPGRRSFQYAVMSFKGTYIEAGVKQLSEEYRAPIIVKEGVCEENADRSGSLVKIQSKSISVSAIKMSEERDSLIVRLYNLTGESASGLLELGRKAKRAWHVSILEERLGEISLGEPTSVDINLRAYEILTIEIEF